jgi:hypothetical protein
MDTLNLHGDAVAWLTDVDLGNGWLVHARLYVHLSLDSVGLAGLWVATHLLGWMLLRIASHLLGWVLLWIASHLLGWILLRVTSHLWLAGLWIAAHLLGWMLLRIASHLLRWVLLWIAAHLWLAGLWVATHLLWWIMLRATNLRSCADLSLGNHAISVNDGYGSVHLWGSRKWCCTGFPDRSEVDDTCLLPFELDLVPLVNSRTNAHRGNLDVSRANEVVAACILIKDSEKDIVADVLDV